MTKHGLSLQLGYSNDYLGKLECGHLEPRLSRLRELAVFFREQGHPFESELEAALGIACETEVHS